MPRHWKDRPVRLKATPKPKAPTAKHVWPVIEGLVGKPGWWRVPTTEGLSTLDRLVKTVRMRAFRHGFDSDCMTLLGTRREGVCFTWRIRPDQLLEVMRRRDERCKKRTEDMRQWRAATDTESKEHNGGEE
jgi:hypothetical protein